MSYETCSLCDKGIITEADMFIFQHRPSGDIYFHLDCYAEKFRSIPVVGASQRGKDWINYCREVLMHIENYTIPQYGDAPNDEISKWTIEECLKDISKRLSRYGRQAREGQQELDFKKMAHVIQIAATKYQEEQNATR